MLCFDKLALHAAPVMLYAADMAQSNSDISPDILRLTVPEAAGALGISPEAVRNRLSRGTLESVKEDGTVYLLLEADRAQRIDGTPPGISAESAALISAKDETIVDLREQLSFLRAELLTRNEELRRKDHIIAALTERIPELEPVAEPRESPVSASEASDGSEEGGPADQERSWWRRYFGF
jgi:hypothetical protein